MNVFISADDNYVLPAQVMLTSFLENNKFEKHTIFFMHNEIQQNNLKKLKHIVESFDSKFVPLEVTDKTFNQFTSTERFPINIYYRLSIPSLLPDTEDRALWLDVDLIVNNSLKDFYYQDFDGHAFAACKDIENREAHLKKLNLPINTPYINSGVILFNLPVMRQYSLNDYYDFFTKHRDAIIWPDQDILNGVFVNKIKVLSNNMYNVQISNWRYKGEYDLNKVTIIHYIGNSKPWFRTYSNSAAEIWDKYYSLTFNKGNYFLFSQKMHRFLEKIVFSKARNLIVFLYKKLPFVKKLKHIIKKS